MAQTLLQRLEASLRKEGFAPGTRQAQAWLLQKTKNLKPTRQALLKDRENLRNKTIIGRMYYFFYDPKLKDTLPYYDRFPLVIPIERYSDGFLGLNLHYVSPKIRVRLLNKLSAHLTNTNYDENTRFRLSYDMLRGASSIPEFEPCLKRYLYNQVESRFLEIPAQEWDIACLLPNEQFVKKSKDYVQRESARNI
jgi:hypothetical protein